MRRTWTVYGRTVERAPVVAGAVASTAGTVLVGVVLGSFAEERSTLALLVNLGLFASMFTGGAVAGYLAREQHLLAGTLSALAPAVLAAVVQVVRLALEAETVPWLALPLAGLLMLSLGTLGGLLGGWRSQRRRSLLG